MLPKSKRLTGNDFKGLKTRIVYRGAFFDMALAPSTSTKFACIISKKRIKRAVDRNKAKRKTYEAINQAVVSHQAFILIYPTKNILSIPSPSLREEVQKAFATL